MTTFKQLRCKLLVMLTHKIALPVIKIIRKEKPFPYSKEQLLQMPEGTIGKDLLNYLESRNLQLLSHYARHDMKHLILGYNTTEEGELCMQSFMLGNGRVSFPVLITVVFGFVTPEYWKKMRLAFQLGKQCKPIHTWHWFELVPMQTISIRNKIYQSKK